MDSYVIAQLKPGEVGGFAPRGAVKALWKTRNFATIVGGPAETGKTWGCLQYADALLWKYPGCQGVMARKMYAWLIGSAVRTFLRILGPDSPVKAYGGERPQWFDYPNGSRLWLAGLDNPGKALSSERDFIYLNQAEELTLNDFETLTTRVTGRGAVMPYTRIFGDANPGPPRHWIKQKQTEGKLELLESRHEDNPTLFTASGAITPQGIRSIGILDALTGVRKARLRHGRWVQAEGVVYDNFDAAIHLIPRFKIPASWRRIRSIDFGYTNPFVCQWIAIDPDGRMFLYREIYWSKRLVEDHAKNIVRLSQGESIEQTFADWDAEDRATLERHGVPTTAAHKAITPGIQAVAGRLQKAGDGRARLYILEGSLVERDPELEAARLPCSTVEEFDVYMWPKGQDGKPIKELPLDKDNHGMDTIRYAVASEDLVDRAEFASVDTSQFGAVN